MTPSNLPGLRWFSWIANLTVRIGVLTGVYLSTVMVIAVIAANRVHFLDDFADIRNWTARIAFSLVMLTPLCSFYRSPLRMIASSALGWALFTLAYAALGIPFERLHLRFFTPFHLFMLGMCIYGIATVLAWLAGLAGLARESHSAPAPVVHSRRTP